MAPKLVPFLVSPLLLIILLLLNYQSVESRTLKPSVSEFTQLLQTLEGSVVKGQTLQGLNQLKRYLQHYGYYPNADADNPMIADDHFDETLESAVKLYQKNYRLPVTGRVDARTIKEMTVPRCGNPDIVHRSPAAANNTFFDGTPRWSKSHLTYSFVAGTEVVPFDQLRQVCGSAFSKWAHYSGFTFQEAAAGTNPDITIGFFSGDHNDGAPFDGTTGTVVAHVFRRMLHFNADERWSTTQPPSVDQLDLETVAMHEIGHLLGLGHSMDPNSIMFPEFGQGAVVKRVLTQDDINAIDQALYPN